MKLRTLSGAMLPALLALAAPSLALAQEGVVWTDYTTGTLGGSTVTTTGFGTTSSIVQNDLSNSNYSFAPLSTAQDTVNYGAHNQWSAAFAPALNNGVLWYGASIRGAGGSPTTTDSEYTFNHTPVIVSGFGGASVSGNTLSVPTGAPFFYHGILQFTGPIDTLSCTTTNTGISFQSCTLGTAPPPPTPGVAFCFGDGTGTACPCANPGGADEGCANSSGSGGMLAVAGTASVTADDLAFTASNLLPGQPALLFAGQNEVNGGSGSIFGDGLRCAGTSVVRLGTQTPDAGGNASYGPGLAATGGWSSGDTLSFQAWYRDPGGPCGANFNLSHGTTMTFTP